MNSRQTSFNNNECQKTNVPLAQYSSNVASSYNVRPPDRSLGKISNVHPPKTYDLRFHEPSAIQTPSAAVSYPAKQIAIYSPRLTHQTSLTSHQTMHNSRDRHVTGLETPAGNAPYPTTHQFAKIPCNLDSVQSSQRSNNTCVSYSNYSDNVPSHKPSSNMNNISTLHGDYRDPFAGHHETTSYPFSSYNNQMKEPPLVSNMPPPSSNLSSFIRQPSLSSNIPEFIRHSLPPGSSIPDFIRQQPQPGSTSSNFIQQPTVLGTINPDYARQQPLQVSSNPDFIRQPPPPSGFGNPDFIRQPPTPGSNNLDFMRHPPPSGSDMPHFIKQHLPPVSIFQPHPPSSNLCVSSGHLPYTSQIPPLNPSDTPYTTLNQGPNLSMPPPSLNSDWVEENKLNKFMEKFIQKKKSWVKTDLTVIEFRNKLKNAFATVRKLMEYKESLLHLLDADENEWNGKLNEALQYKDQLTKDCDFLSQPKVLNWIQSRLKSRKRKRELKKKIRLDKIKERTQKLANHDELHRTIDKWLESIKEKNLKLKREADMKKEADSILAEVRRKIHEAKRTIDKIKVFEKLRSARQANAVKKGLFLPDHDRTFQTRVSELKSMLFKQLSDYESEEKALKVMLEAEQEGQLEEEALWRIKKLKTFQQRRQKNIVESLFGNEEEPSEDDPIFLFHQFQNSGNKSIENLVQIRHHWDLHLNKDGEAVPSQWVVPVPPSSALWEVALKS